MADTSPKVSTIIPCFNLGAFLDEAVTSVLDQTYQDFEILIVDDGSTDPETIRLLDNYVRPKTTVFRTANRGLAAARNFLVARARGKYLCSLDADDRLRPQFFEKTLSAIEGDPSISFVSTHLQMFGTEERVWPSVPRCDLATLLAEDTVITPALVKASAVRAVGGYDEHMPAQGDEDWDLWISLVEAGHRGVILPEVLFDYRRRPGSMCIECTTGQTHLDLVTYLLDKHKSSYQAHLLDVLLHKEAAISGLRSYNVRLEEDLAVRLTPQVERRRAELETLRAELSRAQGIAAPPSEAVVGSASRAREAQRLDSVALQEEVDRLADEVRALRASASWRVTAPLRAAYERLSWLRARSGH